MYGAISNNGWVTYMLQKSCLIKNHCRTMWNW